ncbi:MAG: hypothetical protein AAFR96_04520 [Planctomycetota bacterium]
MKTRILGIALAAGAAATASADFATDFGVASNGAGQLAVEFNFNAIEPIANFAANGVAVGGPFDGLPVAGGFSGFFSDEPGFANFEEDEADEGLFVVPDGTVVAFELISASPAFTVYDLTFDNVVNPGENIELGSVQRDAAGNVISGFDDHPWWTVDTDNPAYDENVFSYDLTFRLIDIRDDGTAGLAPTAPITVTFTRIPTPGTAALLGLAGLGAARRRR